MRNIRPEDRDRFTDEEAALFEAGLCNWVTEYGNGHGVAHCGKLARDPTDSAVKPETGYCPEHVQEWHYNYAR